MPSNDAQYSYNLLINLVNSVNKESKKLEDSKKRLNQKTNNVKKLEEKLRKELKKGAVVITQTYHFPNWRPYKKVENFWLYRA